jgi:orotate phosphoribosyltransferase
MMFNYRTIADLNSAIYHGVPFLPWKPDVIAGVHRSGLLAATLFSAHLNVPVISVKDFCRGCDVYAGYRSYVSPEEQEVFLAEPRKVLVVEDACNEGNTLRQEIERIERHSHLTGRHTIHCVSVYVSDLDVLDVPSDFSHFEVVKAPRLFEWNWVNHSVLSESCMEIDGVLCRLPSPRESADDKSYRRFIADVGPLFTPKRPIGRLVTRRLERWRKDTVSWLAKHDIAYGQLDMMPTAVPDDWGDTRFKHDVFFHQGGTKLFVEYKRRSAHELWKLSKLPVLCVETRELFQGT